MPTKKTQTRTERDALGSVKVPKDAYYGSFTARALENFNISKIKAFPSFRIALANIKIAAAQSNAELGELQKGHAKAIIQAANEFIEGKYYDEFPIDIFQAGAGTPFNMNLNEILANRANEILGGKKGEYKPITPNNHVNWGQSSNDTIPTAIRLAALMEAQKLLPEIDKLSKAFFKKAKQFKNILKIGRTHLQDAVPITLGQEFEAWGSTIKRTHDHIKQSFGHLQEVAIGGTALGTGITAHPKYRTLMVKNLTKLTKIRLRPTKYPMELSSNMSAFAIASASLSTLGSDLVRISKDLRILASGPAGGINEINLPEVEPGSSIMPGKVNPSIAECITMIGLQVNGNHHTVAAAVHESELELNTMTPVIMLNLLWSIHILQSGCAMFRDLCIKGITANTDHIEQLLDKSLCLATGLSPYIGYKATAELVNEALKKGTSLMKTVESKDFMTKKELSSILSAKKLTKPHATDQNLKKRIQNNPNYQKFMKKIG